MTFRYIALSILVVFAATAQSEDDLQSTSLLSRSNGLFSSNLYFAVSSGKSSSLVCPVSLNLALTLASFGTDGNSLKELRTTLNQPNDENAIVSSYKAYTDNTKKSENLTIVTKMFVDNQFELKEDFKKVAHNFDAEIENVDFASHPEESRVKINKFVEEKTNHLIPQLFQSGDINKDTSSIIVNAVYFKSSWIYPFLKLMTSKKTFYGLDAEGDVDMMYRPGTSLKYLENNELNAQIVELPYKGGYSFIVILPKEKPGILEVENKLKSKANSANSSVFLDIFKDAQYTNVEVFLPKFTFEQTHNLRQTLEELGVKDIFSTNANFQKLSEKPVVVTNVVQKVYISVSEEQTVAAAATGISIQPLSASFPVTPPRVFNANHPFLYIIKHDSLETPLFIGRYMGHST